MTPPHTSRPDDTLGAEESSIRYFVAQLLEVLVALAITSVTITPDPDCFASACATGYDWWVPMAFLLGLPATLLCFALSLTLQWALYGTRELPRRGWLSRVLWITVPVTATVMSVVRLVAA
ncbi:hypothetical protein GB931_16785 [Modestobacter sp. I12A-02628]|uniref:Uncharacterized protein n=1 Tax=Goekera deserti TaxID=2497753 RepID=A0A7K3WFV8_9ACTN|nr:hypothetical protein [Goekera deserti]MPQ99541.1 hypothetical protein [Goekera deserti]NDI46447.1 hypothetical protein [Goekera deserti]NEL54620.1 hypothetical protein [Goekera deserti]